MLNLIVVERYRGRIFLSSVTLSYLRIWVCQSLKNSVKLYWMTVVLWILSWYNQKSQLSIISPKKLALKTCHWWRIHYDVDYKAPFTPVKKKPQLWVPFLLGVPKLTRSCKEWKMLMQMFSINIKSSSRSAKTKRTTSSSTLPAFLGCRFPFWLPYSYSRDTMQIWLHSKHWSGVNNGAQPDGPLMENI